MGRLNGKVAIITGGGQGVGLGIAQVYASEGASLVLSGRTLAKLERVVGELEARGGKVAVIAADARLRSDADKVVAFAVKKFGGVDILVNNAQSASAGVMLCDYTDHLITETDETAPSDTNSHTQPDPPPISARGGGSII